MVLIGEMTVVVMADRGGNGGSSGGEPVNL